MFSKLRIAMFGGAALVVVSLIAAVFMYRGNAIEAQSELDAAQRANDTLRSSLAVSEDQNEALSRRFDALDASVNRLADTQRRIGANLDQRIKSIRTITQQPGDTDESIACLDQRVPAQLLDSLRLEPAGDSD